MDSPTRTPHRAGHHSHGFHWSRAAVSVLCLILSAAGLVRAQGSVIRVPQDEPTIQAGIDAAAEGAVVLVDTGTYVGEENVNVRFRGKRIVVQSVEGAARTILDLREAPGPLNTARGFLFDQGETPASVLDGFTIRHASNSAIYIANTSPTIQHCVLDSNQAAEGGGLHITGVASYAYDWATPHLVDVVIRHNTAWYRGGGVYVAGQSRPLLEGCQVLGNQVSAPRTNPEDGWPDGGGGIYVQGGAPELVNGLLAGNSHFGVRVVGGWPLSPLLRFCTLTGNEGGLYLSDEGTVTVQNSLLWGNDTQVYLANVSRGITVSYSLVQGGLAGFGGNTTPRDNSTYANTIDADPLFVDAPEGDYHLRPSSTAIGRGIGDETTVVDLEGRARGLRPDLGAFEHPLDQRVTRTYFVSRDGDDQADGTQEAPFRTLQQGIEATLDGDTVRVRPGPYTGEGNVNVRFRGKRIVVRSVEGAAQTILDLREAPGPLNTARGFLFDQGETAASVLDGFTIRHAPNSALYIANTSPTIQHCVLDSNQAAEGGGLHITGVASYAYDWATPHLIDVVIRHNTAWYRGGGIYVAGQSRPLLEGCQVLGNQVSAPRTTSEDGWPDGGGGIYVQGGAPELVNGLLAGNRGGGAGGGGVRVVGGWPTLSPVLRFCTLTGNEGGLYVSDEGTVTVQNSLLWGTDTPVYLANVSRGITVSYSLVQGGLAGFGGNTTPRANSTYTDNIDADADFLFVDAQEGDYRLQPNSPAIDAGLRDTGVDRDIRGYSRSLGAGPDLGAYESPIEPFTEIGQAAGVAGDASDRGVGTAFLDYDGDGDLDLYLAKAGSDRLYRNEGDGAFTDVSASAGIADNLGGRGVFSGDYDNDGDLDLYITTTGASLLYRNNGNGTFQNVASEAGVAESGTGAAFADYDGDGDLDFYLATANGMPNRLYRNDGNGAFTDVAPDMSLANTQSGTAVPWVDYDNDGDFDLHFLVHGNRSWLYRNNDNGTFTDVAIAVGISGSTRGWGAAWGDYDGDGWLDLYLSNNGANRLYRNDGNGTFTDVAPGTTLADAAFSQGASFGDFDGDGDLDLYVANNNSRHLLFRNNRDDRHFLFVRVLDARGCFNRHGSAVFVREAGTGELVGARLVGGTAYFAGNAYDAHFGLDPDLDYDVEVSFPDGSTHALGPVVPAQLPGQLLVVRQPLALATIPDTAAGYADSLRVPVQVVNQTDAPIVTAELDIAYDTGVIPSLTLESPGTLSSHGWLVQTRTATGVSGIDTLKVAMAASGSGISGAGDLFRLRLETADIRRALQTSLELAHVDFNSGQTRVDARGGRLRLRGTDGLLSTDPPEAVSRQSVRLLLADADEDRTAALDSLQVLVFNGARTDSERVWLVETTPASGLFSGAILTAHPFPIAKGDRLLSLAAGDSLVVAYLDSLTASGSTATRFTQTRLVAEVEGKLQATRVLQARTGRTGRDTLRVQIVDPTLNLAALGVDTARVTLRNRVSGEQETVALVETGANTAIFRSRVATAFGASGTNGDRILAIAAGDTLEVRRSDGTLVFAHVVDRFGDLSGNGAINAEDAFRILQVVSGSGAVSPQDSLVADVDGDNDILALDASLVLQYGLGMINRFPVQVDTSFSAADPKNHPFLKPVAAGNLLAFGTPQVEEGGTFLVPLRLGERDGVLSGRVRLGIGPGLAVVEVLPGAGYGDYLLAHAASEGSAGIAFAGARAVARGAGEVVVLRLRVSGEQRDAYPLSLEEVVLNGSVQPLSPQAMALTATDLLPRRFALHPNQPNPFNPSTLIRYDLAAPGEVELTVYNLQGQKVRTFAIGRQPAGVYRLVWDGRDQQGRPAGSGVYLLHLRAGQFAQTRKMALVR